ncbi:cation transporter [Pseudohongiella acticola]|uniref:Cation transporter n=2 Tax=Pseudohongiellaceae TaxID=3085095 RepID=A0A1E8CNA8_9GAMM|nr:cation transporter [Pseudohongiella acticola]
MDCAAEEQMVRMAFAHIEPPPTLIFDLKNRSLRIVHSGKLSDIQSRLEALRLGAKLQSVRELSEDELTQTMKQSDVDHARESYALKWLLAINGTMFSLELIVGWIAQSTGLIADSLDMFADAAVYGLALYAVGRASSLKLRAAHLAGLLQMLLALSVLGEVVRRFFLGSEPVSGLMISFGMLALAANIACLIIIHREKDSGAHMKASWIFSANDVIANVGVILAGVLVTWTGSSYPDLVIGFIIGAIVLNGAWRILQLKN